MNGYFFTANLIQAQVVPTPGRAEQIVDTLQTWDTCVSAIVYGGNPEQAQKQFEAWCCRSREAENPVETDIIKVVAAQFVGQLLTESGDQPLDWSQISRQINDALLETAVDNFEQGYWVDINQTLPPGKISLSLESLKDDVAEDIRSGLNWSPDKQFFFLISILSQPLPPPGYSYGKESDETDRDPASDDDATETESPILDGSVAALPELMDKEAAALVQARNSVVAAWLWRKYAANTRLALNEIYITPCCSLIPVE